MKRGGGNMRRGRNRLKSPDGGGMRRFFTTIWYALTDGGI